MVNYAKNKLDMFTQFIKLNPHWLLFAISLICWGNYLASELFQAGYAETHAHHHHHGAVSVSLSGILAGQLYAWLFMVYAMMLPMVSGPLRWLILAQPRYQRKNAMVFFVAGYSCLWLVIGFILIATQSGVNALISVSLPTFLPWETITFLFAGLLSRATYRKRAVYACGGGMPVHITGWRMLFDSFRFGVIKAIRCAASCLHLMIALMIVGHGILLMLLITAALFYERQLLPKKNKVIERVCYLVALGYFLRFLQVLL